MENIYIPLILNKYERNILPFFQSFIFNLRHHSSKLIQWFLHTLLAKSSYFQHRNLRKLANKELSIKGSVLYKLLQVTFTSYIHSPIVRRKKNSHSKYFTMQIYKLQLKYTVKFGFFMHCLMLLCYNTMLRPAIQRVPSKRVSVHCVLKKRKGRRFESVTVPVCM